MMPIQLKKEIIQKHENSMRVIELARLYNHSMSMISTVLKQKDAIKITTSKKGTTILSQLRTDFHREMEKLLLVWLKDKELANDTMMEGMICEKPRTIYADLKREAALTSGAVEDSFKASYG